MGLIKAALGSLQGTLADQYKEFFYCDSIPNDILVVKGRKRASNRSSNKGDDNIISQGSLIAVADGQAMIIVEQGKIVEFCNEPGEYTFDASTEPSIFNGGLNKETLMQTFNAVGKRFTFGGVPPKDQRVYYFNMKEILDNKFGTQNPVYFKIIDNNIGLDMDTSVRCNGMYSYQITNPMTFYTKLCSNVTNTYDRSEIDAQLKSEFMDALQPAFFKISELGIRPSGIPAHTKELAQAMKEELSQKWTELRGISIVSLAINSVSIPKEDEDALKEAQRQAMYANTKMAAGSMVQAQTEAMKMAAGNPGGAMMGFMGMNMATQQGGLNAQNLFNMNQQQQMQQQQQQQSENSWTCSCGTANQGKFCANCGNPKPAPAQANGWTCSCGTLNQGKFCSNCGSPKPSGAPLYKCDKCGYEIKDPSNPPKFCPECGDVFDKNDIVK